MRALLFLAVAAGCQAAPILTVAFSPNTESGFPGNTVIFSGSLTNNTGNTVFINSDTVTLTGFPASALDDSPFLTNAPVSLGPNASTGVFVFLDVTIPNNQSPATYDGVFTALGGADGTAQDNLGSAAYHVQVQSAITPEPSSLLLVGLGLAALAGFRLLVDQSKKQRAIHQRMVELAVEHKVVQGRKMRVDTTVVETNIHYPTDRVPPRAPASIRRDQASGSSMGSPEHSFRG